MSRLATVYIVEDDRQSRQFLAVLVESMGLNPVLFSSGDDFLEQVSQDEPGCLVTNLGIAGASGLHILRQVTRRRLPISVIVVTSGAPTAAVVEVMRSGALTCLEKSCPEHVLMEAICDGLRASGEALSQRHREQEIQHRMTSLTHGEREMLQLVAQGQSNKQSPPASVSPYARWRTGGGALCGNLASSHLQD